MIIATNYYPLIVDIQPSDFKVRSLDKVSYHEVYGKTKSDLRRKHAPSQKNLKFTPQDISKMPEFKGNEKENNQDSGANTHKRETKPKRNPIACVQVK